MSEDEIRRERERARVLRQSTWWKRRRAIGRCGYCGRSTPPRELTMDHRIPLVRGGRSTRGNVVPACKACNTAKRYRLPMEWEPPVERDGAAGEKTGGQAVAADRSMRPNRSG